MLFLNDELKRNFSCCFNDWFFFAFKRNETFKNWHRLIFQSAKRAIATKLLSERRQFRRSRWYFKMNWNRWLEWKVLILSQHLRLSLPSIFFSLCRIFLAGCRLKNANRLPMLLWSFAVVIVVGVGLIFLLRCSCVVSTRCFKYRDVTIEN